MEEGLQGQELGNNELPMSFIVLPFCWFAYECPCRYKILTPWHSTQWSFLKVLLNWSRGKGCAGWEPQSLLLGSTWPVGQWLWLRFRIYPGLGMASLESLCAIPWSLEGKGSFHGTAGSLMKHANHINSGQNCSLGSFVIEDWLPRSNLQRYMILITLSCVGKVQGQTWETMRRSWPWTWPPMLPVPHSWKRSREQVFVLSHSLVVLMTET